MHPAYTEATLKAIESNWNMFIKDHPFHYEFLDRKMPINIRPKLGLLSDNRQADDELSMVGSLVSPALHDSDYRICINPRMMRQCNTTLL